MELAEQLNPADANSALLLLDVRCNQKKSLLMIDNESKKSRP